MSRPITQFRDEDGNPVTFIAENVFAITRLTRQVDVDGPAPVTSVRVAATDQKGDPIFQIISTGGFAIEVVVPKGQTVESWMTGE